MILSDYRDKRPLYEQMAEKLERLIVNGGLEPLTRMPSVRSLAVELSVNPNTVQRAYAQLEQDGLAKADRTAGRLVTRDAAALEAVRIQEARAVIQQYFEAMAALGYTREQALALLKEEFQ